MERRRDDADLAAWIAGTAVACGLCQTKVPCESRIPDERWA